MKVAKLVRVSLVTRVIVEDTASEADILDIAVPKLCDSLKDCPLQHVEEIVDDIECPYVEEKDTNVYTFDIRVKTGRLAAYKDNILYGSMSIKTGRFIGNTACMVDLYNYRENYLKTN